MSGYGWNSGAGSSNGFRLNPTPIRCEICNRVLIGSEAFLSHYETHLLGDSFTLRPVREVPTFHSSFQNNFNVQQQALQSNLLLAPSRNPLYSTIHAPPAPQARPIWSAYPAMQQQIYQPPLKIERRGYVNPPNVNARPIPAPVNQPARRNQPAVVPAPDEIDLVDSDNDSESSDGSNDDLDLTLRL